MKVSPRKAMPRFLLGMAIVAAIALLNAALSSLGFYDPHIAADFDYLTRKARAVEVAEPYSDRITIVDINQDDYDSSLFRGTSPLDETILRRIINAIVVGYAPKILAIDIVTDSRRAPFNTNSDTKIVWSMCDTDTNCEQVRTAGYRLPSLSLCAAIPKIEEERVDHTVRFYRQVYSLVSKSQISSFIHATASAYPDKPLDCNGTRADGRSHRIKFSGPRHKFARIPASLVLADAAGPTRKLQISREIVILGGTYGIGDLHWTPLSAEVRTPGVEVTAHAVETEISGEIHDFPPTTSIALDILLNGLVLLATLWIWRPFAVIVCLCAGIGLTFLAARFLYGFSDLFLPVFPAFIGAPVACATDLIVHEIRGQRDELKKLRKRLENAAKS
jgi:CHASE2 domain-containing sensor protein